MDEFYRMNPKLFRRRLPFYEERLKNAGRKERKGMNLQAWLNGRYVYLALAGLSGKPYVSEPEKVFLDDEEIENANSKEAVEEKINNAADGFRAFAFVFNREREKKRKEAQLKDGEHRQSVNSTDSIDQQGECGADEANGQAEHTE